MCIRFFILRKFRAFYKINVINIIYLPDIAIIASVEEYQAHYIGEIIIESFEGSESPYRDMVSVAYVGTAQPWDACGLT